MNEVFIDFDGTIYRGDSFLDFLRSLGFPHKLRLLRILSGNLTKNVRRSIKLSSILLYQTSTDEERRELLDCFRKTLVQKSRANVVEILNHFQNFQITIVTASPQFYVEEEMKNFGIRVIGARLVENRLVVPNGRIKRSEILELVGRSPEGSPKGFVTIGNCHHDLPMLTINSNGYLINSTKRCRGKYRDERIHIIDSFSSISVA
jgi:phosphoserine phosphatase